MAPTAELILDFNMPYGEISGYYFNCKVFDEDSSFHLLFNGQYVGTIDSNKNGVLEQTTGVPIPETTLTLIKEKIVSFTGKVFHFYAVRKPSARLSKKPGTNKINDAEPGTNERNTRYHTATL